MSRNTRQHCLIRVSRNTRQHCLIRVSRYTRQHTPYSGVKKYQATLPYSGVKKYQATLPYSGGNTALFGCQEIPGNTALFGCQDIPGNISLIRCQDVQGVIRPIRCQDTPGIRLIQLVIKFYQAFTSLRVSWFTIHVHNNFIPGKSAGIKLTNLNNSEKLGKNIPVMLYLRCTLSIVRTQLTLNWAHFILHACNRSFNSTQAKLCLCETQKPLNISPSNNVQEIPEPSGVQQDWLH